jgi:hypothetical protein
LPSIDQVRALRFALDELQRSLDEVVRRAVSEGVDRTALAAAVGVSRPQFYRLYVPPSSTTARLREAAAGAS